MVHLRKSGLGPVDRDSVRSWGTFIRHSEIGEDGYAVRQVDVFANGNVLRYDRWHWADAFGRLGDVWYSPQDWDRWWGPSEPITSTEFEQVWAAAETSPLRPLQLATAAMDRYGSDARPPWLRRA